MNKSKILATAFAAAALSISPAYADSKDDMEKCKIVDKNGRGLIKENKADCSGKNVSCAGGNKAGDPESWILVPKGECEKINNAAIEGKLNDIEIPSDIKAKIEIDQ